MASLAQPYIDIVNLRHFNSPDAGIWRRYYQKAIVKYSNLSLTLPLTLKKEKDILVFSPYAERWDIQLPSTTLKANVNGFVLPISFIHTLKNSNWIFNTTFIIRNNAEQFSLPDAWQAGGFIVANYKKNKQLTYKFGLYFNQEAFGSFFVPLLGLEWKIDSTLFLWGTLPGTLTLEKRISSKWYTGAAFKAITNSYQLRNGSFVRIDDNIISGILDYYLTKKWVINAELGHSVFRRVRFGERGTGKNYFYKEKINDNLFFKIAIAYRWRL